jgi:hypothetical protein
MSDVGGQTSGPASVGHAAVAQLKLRSYVQLPMTDADDDDDRP